MRRIIREKGEGIYSVILTSKMLLVIFLIHRTYNPYINWDVFEKYQQNIKTVLEILGQDMV